MVLSPPLVTGPIFAKGALVKQSSGEWSEDLDDQMMLTESIRNLVRGPDALRQRTLAEDKANPSGSAAAHTWEPEPSTGVF